jgi:hypothetical protein
VDFQEALDRLGFRQSEQRVVGDARLYRLDPNRFLTYWLHVYADGTALLTWEFAIVDYFETKELQLGSSESLNLYLFPKTDDRGQQDAVWLAGALDRAEERLRSVRLDDPEGSAAS